MNVTFLHDEASLIDQRETEHKNYQVKFFMDVDQKKLRQF